MKTIYKYNLYEGGYTKVPFLRNLLDIQLQGEDIVAWFEVSTIANRLITEHSTEITLVGTGREIPEDFSYFKTIQQPPFVWHVYYKE